MKLAAQLTDDPDEQVRAMAVAHQEAVREVRELLTGVFEPGDATGACDYLIGPVVVTVARAGDAAEAGLWLDDEIRRHLDPAMARSHSPILIEQLVTWWADEESRRWD